MQHCPGVTGGGSQGESSPELILEDSYKSMVQICPKQILAEWTTDTPRQNAQPLDGKSWAQTEAMGQTFQVDQGSESGRSWRERTSSWEGPKREIRRAGNNPVSPALD